MDGGPTRMRTPASVHSRSSMVTMSLGGAVAEELAERLFVVRIPCCSTRAMMSAGVKRARADLAKCGLAERKFSGRVWTLVKLQRPPPEMRIFLPTRSRRGRER